MTRSKTVDKTLKNLCATAYAKRAMSSANCSSFTHETDKYFEATEKWLMKAGAEAMKWTFRMPST